MKIMTMAPTRVFRNRHASAKAALDHWMAHGLWGNPIQLGPDKFHVYGASVRTWHLINVEFLPDRIVVMRPIPKRRP